MNEAVDVVRRFCDLQRRLLSAWTAEAKPEIRDWGHGAVFYIRPQTGSFAFDGATCDYQLHGGGVRFTSAAFVVDAHTCGVDVPDAITAYRLWRFCESQRVTELRYRDATTPAADERPLDALLDAMAADGELEALAPRLFRPRHGST